ncbi:MAG TPA: RIO1 family regulatory kinase/ATPase [Trebonia sp.]|jgi:RIO kinase 1|nr:RIO1 family regulatory kinase/ATPase [Trebonia sp.]
MRDSADSDDYGVTRRGRKRGQFDDADRAYVKRDRHRPRLQAEDAHDATDGLPEGDRWSTWDQSTPLERGPKPHPKWLVTDLAAVDSELGILKTGKEADVYLIRRHVPGTGKSCLLAAKRYRDAEHRLFHRDAGYLEGRRVKESRINRATASRSAFGKQMIAGQWANAEFTALCRLHAARVPVPYPVQVTGTEVLLEFIGDADGTAAPRLAETRPDDKLLVSLWEQFTAALDTLARHGLAHGDLSPYNLLVHQGRLVLIDLPQVVDVIAHPTGRDYLARDARNVASWFAARGLPAADPDALARRAAEQAGLALAGRLQLASPAVPDVPEVPEPSEPPLKRSCMTLRAPSSAFLTESRWRRSDRALSAFLAASVVRRSLNAASAFLAGSLVRRSFSLVAARWARSLSRKSRARLAARCAPSVALCRRPPDLEFHHCDRRAVNCLIRLSIRLMITSR